LLPFAFSVTTDCICYRVELAPLEALYV